jgi:tetratricopeptide (TPR) repeat protein
LQQDGPVKENRHGTALWRLVVEKIPLFALVGLLSVITFNVQRGGGVMSGLEKLGLDSRVANAVISYATYIEKMIWPGGLAVFYPHPGGNYSEARAVVSGIVLALLTVAFLYPVLRRRYLAVGWLWYVGTLVPVIGLVQVGAQARADRYMYLTMIGLLAIAAWGVADLVARWRNLRPVAVLAAVVVLAAAAVGTRVQLRHWKDSAALFRHALEVTRDNVVMLNNYANLLTDAGQTEEAIKHFERSLELRPNSAEVHNNLGNALSDLGRTAEAIFHYREALRLEADFAPAHYNLARVLAEQGKDEQAISEYRQAVRKKPDYAEAWNELGFVLAKGGRFEEATECYRKAIGFEPNLIIAHGRLALVLARLGRIDQAIEHCRIVLRARPDDVEMHFNVGYLLEQRGRTADAVQHYRTALRINPSFTKALQRLTALSAGQGNR